MHFHVPLHQPPSKISRMTEVEAVKEERNTRVLLHAVGPEGCYKETEYFDRLFSGIVPQLKSLG